MKAPLRVLLVEDNPDDATLIVRYLQQGGYDVAFERVDTPAGVRAAVAQRQWDLVICDYSMPQFSGTDALQLLRETGADTPFIFVSGTIGEETAVEALKLGAQDYVLKGNLKRLLPAIQRELREAEQRRERAALENRLKLLERFEAIGRLAAGIAHDFNNVIGAVMGLAHMGYEEAAPDARSRARFQKISEQAQRAAGLTAQLLAFARRQVLQPRQLDLNESITEMISFLRAAIGESIELKTILSPDLKVIRADPTQIEQVLMNLCLNGRDAMSPGGRLLLETRNVEINDDFCRTHNYGVPGSYVLLQVSDTGTGMDAATLDRMFEPFFTTKELGRGTGLGLATVYGIVKQHEGFINVYSEPGQGTTFHVYFPARAGTAERRESVPVTRVSRGTETVLVADDHEALRDIAQEFLSSCGYTVILAKNGQEAVRLFEENQAKIQIVILDVAMPLLTGPAAYAQIRALKPGVPVIFTTGHTAESASLNSHIDAGGVFLQKPYAPQELSQVVRSTLDRKPLP